MLSCSGVPSRSDLHTDHGFDLRFRPRVAEITGSEGHTDGSSAELAASAVPLTVL
jgi:hypothetical protein